MPTSRRDFTDQADYTLHRDFIRTLPEDFCRRHQVVLIGKKPASAEHHAILGMLDPADGQVIKEVENLTGLKFKQVQLNSYELDQALEFAFKESEIAQTTINAGPVRERIALHHDQKITFERDQKPVDICGDLLACDSAALRHSP